MDFINKIFSKKQDQEVHEQFVRFGKGIYENRAVIKLQKNTSIKISSTFEYCKDFAVLMCDLVDKINVNGLIISRVNIPELNGKIKSGVYEYFINKEISSNELKKILEKVKYALLNISGNGIELKCKQKLPKPGKSSDAKIDNKFCQLTSEIKYWGKIREFFFSDLPDNMKKAIIKHTFDVKNIIIPSGINDYEQLRLLSKRSGKITRFLEIDKKETKKEIEFEV